MKIAAIDIGSNAARLLINEVKEHHDKEPEFIKLNLLRVPFRLGMDVFTLGKIEPEKEIMIVKTMKVFAQLMEIYCVEHYRACATSAMRDAKNGQEIITSVQKESGIQIEIISGDEEANLIYENHIAEGLDKNFGYLYIDVGGGSTELTHYKNGKIHYQHSFNIGTIRLLNDLVSSKDWDEMKTEVKNKIAGKPLLAIGSGGNINKIFSLSKTKEGKPLSDDVLKKFYKELKNMSLEERMTKYKLREDRADVIVPALEIFTKVLNWADTRSILVPKISLADGLIHSIYDQLKKDEKNKKAD